MSVMWALIRKDWRLYRVPVVALMIAMAAPYVLGAMVYQYAVWDYQQRPFLTPPDFYRDYIQSAAILGVGLVMFLCPVFGAVAFATERRERWADFLAMLPVTKNRTMLSKLLVSGACLLVACAAHTVVLQWIYTEAPGLVGRDHSIEWSNIFCTIAGGIGGFGIGWLLSAFIESASIAAALALASMLVIAVVTAIVVGRSAVHAIDPRVVCSKVGWMAITVGAMTVLTGWIYYARRVSP